MGRVCMVRDLVAELVMGRDVPESLRPSYFNINCKLFNRRKCIYQIVQISCIFGDD